MGDDRGALDPQGPVARAIGDLTWVLVALGVVAFAVFAIALAAALRGGRRSTESDDAAKPDRSITLLGVVFPTVVLAVTMVATVVAMRATATSAPEGTLEIEVVGHRWWYEVRYPDAGVTAANEVHLPVGRRVAFHLSSADVIHSFWIPELGGKLDMLPGRRTTLVLEADEVGTHRSQCAEFCGLQHARMGFVAVVHDERGFEEWLRNERRVAAAPTSASARRGRDVFAAEGCATCHTVRGTSFAGQRGPDLTHLWSRRTLAAATLPMDRDALSRWITDPHEVKEGVRMPPAALAPEERDALLDYLQHLR